MNPVVAFLTCIRPRKRKTAHVYVPGNVHKVTLPLFIILRCRKDLSFVLFFYCNRQRYSMRVRKSSPFAGIFLLRAAHIFPANSDAALIRLTCLSDSVLSPRGCEPFSPNGP